MDDGCCPAGCDANTDNDCSPSCGNGVTEPGETCDGDCKATCTDGNECTLDTKTGSAENCNVACNHQSITECAMDDGCCPAGCNANNDDDCSVSCGNDVTEPGETCDGDCATNCKDGNACTIDTMTGSNENCNVACAHQVITTCSMGDGCCPTGCDANVDDDCSPSCGNGVTEDGETCDGDCIAKCTDGNACTVDNKLGSAEGCNVTCTFQEINGCVMGDKCCPTGCDANVDDDCSPSCGNGVNEEGESCDGDCPTTCEDGNACTKDAMTGSAENCNAACSYTEISQCIHKDGCCAAGCDAVSDDDCSPSCGNGVTEPGETCDGDCVEICSDGTACTIDTLIGSAENCSAACSFQEITECLPLDNCCAPGCDANADSDCSVKCGNGVIEPGETCDGDCLKSCDDANGCTIDTMTGSEENCNVSCSHQPIVSCNFGDGCCPVGCDSIVDDDCSPSCGNGVIEPPDEICESNCITSCDDADACTIDNMLGSPDTCNSSCSFQLVSECMNDDGCCPPGCDEFNDTDCDVCTGPGCDAPDGWTCTPQYYNNQDGCDCNCGVPDPDCGIEGATLYGCDPFYVCTAEGLCAAITDCETHAGQACSEGNLFWTDACGNLEEMAEDCAGHPCANEQCYPDVPAGWTCTPGYYNKADGCDCGCGIPDPDCDIDGATLFGCTTGEYCEAGVCTPITDCEAHASEKCVDGDLYWFDACGNQEELKEACNGAICADSQCWPSVPHDWTCQPRYYNQADGCDCACGPEDPDCSIADAIVYNCEIGEVCSEDNKCVPGCTTTETCYRLFSVPRDVTHTHVYVTGSFSAWADSIETGAMDMFVTADGERWERWVALPHGELVEYKFLVQWGEEPQQWCVLADAATWECTEGAANMARNVDCTTCPE